MTSVREGKWLGEVVIQKECNQEFCQRREEMSGMKIRNRECDLVLGKSFLRSYWQAGRRDSKAAQSVTVRSGQAGELLLSTSICRDGVWLEQSDSVCETPQKS